MFVQIFDPVSQAADVRGQQTDFDQNFAGRLAHAGIPADLLDHLDRQHQQRRRNDDHLGAIRLLKNIVETVVQLGVDRFRRHKHQRHVLGLARDQVFVGDIADMFCDVRTHASDRKFAIVVALCFAKRGHRFEWKFGVDDQGRSVGQVHDAIGPRLVGEGCLEFVAILRQAILNDHLHPRLPEGAARLLVGKHALQARHLGGEVGDVLLRVVDQREPRVQLLQMLGGVLGRRAHRVAQPGGDRVEPLMHRVLQLRLCPGEQFAHGLDARIEFGHPLLGDRVVQRFARPRQHHDDDKDAEGHGCPNGQSQGRGMGQHRIGEGLQIGHPALLQ